MLTSSLEEASIKKQKHGILFVVGTYPDYGGVESVTTILANEFCDRGYNVFIASYIHPQMSLASKLRKDIKLIFLSFPVLKWSNYTTLKKLIASNDIEIIINQRSLPAHHSFFLRLCAIGTDAKLIGVVHSIPGYGLFFNKYSNRKHLFKILQLLRSLIIKISLHISYKLSHCFVLLSDHYIKKFKQTALIVHTKKLVTIANPVQPITLIKDKKKQLLFVGRFSEPEKKNHTDNKDLAKNPKSISRLAADSGW